MNLSTKHINPENETIKSDIPPIRGFQESTLVDWDGKLAATLFLGGCNFRCGFCHSKLLVEDPSNIESVPFCKIAEFLKKKKGWIDGVVIMGGEPTIYEGTLVALIKAIKDLGFQVKLDTNGTNPGLLDKLINFNLLDYVAMDIKAPLEKTVYSKAAGISVDMDKIISSKDILLSSAIEYEFRTTVVPGIVNTLEISKIARSISGAKKYCLQQFVARDTIDPSYLTVKPYTKEEIQHMAYLASRYLVNVLVKNC
jgi:pyruvate formate lyase activating enzyme